MEKYMTRTTMLYAMAAGMVIGLLFGVYTITPPPHYHSPVWFMYGF